MQKVQVQTGDGRSRCFSAPYLTEPHVILAIVGHLRRDFDACYCSRSCRARVTPPAECKWGAHHKKTEPDLNFAFQPVFGFLAPLGIGKLRAQVGSGGLWWALVGSGGLWGALVGSNTPKKISPAAQKRSISAWNCNFRPEFALIPPKKIRLRRKKGAFPSGTLL